MQRLGRISALDEARASLAARLRRRRAEIEEATMVRVYGISDPGAGSDPEYLHGLRAAVSAALDHAIASLELGEDRSPPIPAALLMQARLAARHRVSLDTVLRRYFSGFMLLSDFVFEEAEAELPLKGTSLHRVIQAQSAQLDRVMQAITQEYKLEVEARRASTEQRRVEVVRRLLAGEHADDAELGYAFDRWHIGAILVEQERTEALRALAERHDQVLLRVPVEKGLTWLWLAGRRQLSTQELARQAQGELKPGSRLAMGEPARGIAGWRLSFNQARQVATFADDGDRRVVRFADLGLLASVSRDSVMLDSLRRIYLAPLSEDRDGGLAIRATLRAYFAADRNITSAAAAMNVTRQTVRNRLRMAEEKIGRQLAECSVELEVALRLDQCLSQPTGT